MLSVFVDGAPATQGSKHARPIYRGRGDAKTFTGRVAVVESGSDALKTWREDIRQALLDAGHRFDGATRVELLFLLKRPKSHYGTGRNAGIVRGTAPHWPTTKPDVDKLARAALDAITSAGIWPDDAAVTTLHVEKRYGDDRYGLQITIHEQPGFGL